MSIFDPRLIRAAIMIGLATMLFSGVIAGGCRQEHWLTLRHRSCALISESPVAPPIVRAWALNGKGLARYEAGAHAEAVADFGRAVATHPMLPYIHNNLANAYRVQGDLVRAIASYSRAIAADPGYGRAYINRGMAEFVTGDFPAALADLHHAVRLQPRAASPLTVRGNIKLAMGDAAGALADQTAAIALNPGFGLPYNNRGCAHMMRGKIAAGVADFREALRLSNLNPHPETRSAVDRHSDLLDYAVKAIEGAKMAPPAGLPVIRGFTLVARNFQYVVCDLIPVAASNSR